MLDYRVMESNAIFTGYVLVQLLLILVSLKKSQVQEVLVRVCSVILAGCSICN